MKSLIELYVDANLALYDFLVQIIDSSNGLTHRDIKKALNELNEENSHDEKPSMNGNKGSNHIWDSNETSFTLKQGSSHSSKIGSESSDRFQSCISKPTINGEMKFIPKQSSRNLRKFKHSESQIC